MIQVISGTDRPNSKTLEVARFVLEQFKKIGEPAELMDLNELSLDDVQGGDYYKGARGTFKDAVEKVNRASGLVMIVPEYNGSYPGILKLFIDYWKFPETFENRPVAFVGLGGRWGGLRPVEHLQQVFGYRNSFVFPHRVFITNVTKVFNDGKFSDQILEELLVSQAREFNRYIRALRSEKLDANSVRPPQ